jgi:TetR/AcrR family transcriptional repressor of nem operon
MRRSKSDTATTRAKIIEAAQAEFRQHGLAGSGLKGLMAGAGLTQGGFYKHFQSKAHLVAQVTAASADNLIDGFRKLSPVGAQTEIEAILASYLSTSHRDAPAGCPYAGWGSELAIQADNIRESAVAGLEGVLDLLTARIGDRTSAEREKAMLMMCAMVGALTLSRVAIADGMSSELLTAVKRQLVTFAKEA